MIQRRRKLGSRSPRTRSGIPRTQFLSCSQPVAFRTSWTSPALSSGVYPAVPSKCQQQAFPVNLTALPTPAWRVIRAERDSDTSRMVTSHLQSALTDVLESQLRSEAQAHIRGA